MGKTGIQFPSILLSSSIAFTKFSREVKCFTPSFIYTYAHPHASFSLGVLSTLPKITSFPFPPIPLALLYVAHLGGGVCVYVCVELNPHISIVVVIHQKD